MAPHLYPAGSQVPPGAVFRFPSQTPWTFFCQSNLPPSGPIVLPGKQASLPGLGTLPAPQWLLHTFSILLNPHLKTPPHFPSPSPCPRTSLPRHLIPLTCDGQGHHQTTTPFKTWRVTCQKMVTTHIPPQSPSRAGTTLLRPGQLPLVNSRCHQSWDLNSLNVTLRLPCLRPALQSQLTHQPPHLHL